MSRISKDVMREEMADFRASWEEEKDNFPGGYVPPRLFRNTGFILRDLLESGKIVGNGIGLKPAEK